MVMAVVRILNTSKCNGEKRIDHTENPNHAGNIQMLEMNVDLLSLGFGDSDYVHMLIVLF